MPKTLSPHQASAVASIFDWFGNGNKGHPLVVAPVGAGKSLMIADFIKQVHAQAPRTRIVVVTHVKELLEQNAAELAAHYSDVDWGFYCAGLGQKRLHNDVTFASIQSIHDKTLSFNRAPQIILVDECHLIPHNDATTYRRFIDACIALNSNCKVVGFTGTPFRADSGRLDEGEGKLFDGICYEIDIAWMIREGYLCRPTTPNVETRMNVEGVGMRGGDYIASQLEKAVDIDATTQACVEETIKHGANRRKWLVFTAGVSHCEHVRDAFRAHGISAEMITGETPKQERADIIRRFKAGDFRCLVNVAVLTTGFNVPAIDLLAFMRPTRSPVLYIQCIGRGIRATAPVHSLTTAKDRLDAIANSEKKDCLILDFGGVVETLGPIDAIDIRKKPQGNGKKEKVEDSPFKRCPSCGAICAVSQRYCYTCAYAFIQDNLEKKASNKSLLTEDSEPETYDVISVKCTKHIKKEDLDNVIDGLPLKYPTTLKVSYTTFAGVFTEYVCFEHHKYDVGDSRRYAWEKAIQWHKARLPNFLVPNTTDAAVALGYNSVPVKSVTIRKEGKYSRVIGVEFGKNATPPPQTIGDGEDFLF